MVAVILGAHGVRGDVRVKSFTEFPEDAFAYGVLRDAEGAVLIDPLKARPAKDHFIVAPKTPKQKEDWDALKGTLLHVSRSALPEIEADEVYANDLIGLLVVNVAGEELGRLKAVHNFGAGDLIEVEPANGAKTVFIPFTEEDVPDVDLSAGKIVVTTFDLWADETTEPLD